MRRLVYIFLLFSSISCAQWEPLKVNEVMFHRASLNTPVDTVVFENYRYIYRVKGDSNLVYWTLEKKEKLYTDYWKAAGVIYFSVSMASLYAVPYVRLDLLQHSLAGAVMGLAASPIIYKLTGDKWLTFMLSALAAGAVGGLKELADPLWGGTRSLADGLTTFGFGAYGAFAFKIYLK